MKSSGDREMDTYEAWKARKEKGVSVSGWSGFLIGGAILCLIWAIPVYLIAAVIAGSVTLLPNTSTELGVIGVTWLILESLHVRVIVRNKRMRPDHYEDSFLNDVRIDSRGTPTNEGSAR